MQVFHRDYLRVALRFYLLCFCCPGRDCRFMHTCSEFTSATETVGVDKDLAYTVLLHIVTTLSNEPLRTSHLHLSSTLSLTT